MISDGQWDSVFGLGFGRLQGSFSADVVDTFQSIGDDRVWIVAFGKNCAFRWLWPRNRCRHCKVDEAGEIESKELNFLREADGMRNEANSCANRWVWLKSDEFKFSNLTADEWAALKSFRSHKDVTIKPADKGGAVVVWRTDLYKQEAAHQLADSKFYVRTEKDLTLDNQKVVKTTINELISNQKLPSTA